MGIPAGSIKISLNGSLPGGEIWNTGWWIYGPTLDVSAAASTAANIWSIMSASTGTHLMNALKVLWQTSCAFTGVKVYSYADTTGVASVVGSATGTAVTGTGTKPVQPDQECLVVTLRTALSGSHRRGRMYMPVNGAALDGGGLFSALDVGTVLDGLKADLALVGADPHLSGFPPVVLSKVLGATTPITAISADLRPDIQRRRSNRQARGTPITRAYP